MAEAAKDLKLNDKVRVKTSTRSWVVVDKGLLSSWIQVECIETGIERWIHEDDLTKIEED